LSGNKHLKWASRLDSFCVFVGAMVPTGLVIGNVGFESMMALVGVCWIIRSIIAKQNPWPRLLKNPLVLPWLFWFGSVMISLVWNGAGSKGWVHDIVLIRYFIYFAALLDISHRRSIISALLIGLGAGVLWGLANTIIAYLIGHDIFGHPLIRYTFKLKEASRIASLAAYVGPFFLAWFFLDSKLTRKIKIAIFFVAGIALIQIFHFHIRTVAIASVAGILSILIYFIITNIPRIWSICIVSLMGLSIGAFLKFGPDWNLESLYARFNIWKVAWSMWLDHLFVGVSVSAWPDFYKQKFASGTVELFMESNTLNVHVPKAAHAHNLFLQLLSSTGILGLFSFLWLFVNSIRVQFKNKISGWRNGLITWPVVFCVIGLTGWNIFGSQYQTVFAYFMLLTAVSVVPQQEI